MAYADLCLVEEARPMAGKYLSKYRPAFMEAGREAVGDNAGQATAPAIAA